MSGGVALHERLFGKKTAADPITFGILKTKRTCLPL
jgi:hypothetical protein